MSLWLLLFHRKSLTCRVLIDSPWVKSSVFSPLLLVCQSNAFLFFFLSCLLNVYKFFPVSSPAKEWLFITFRLSFLSVCLAQYSCQGRKMCHRVTLFVHRKKKELVSLTCYRSETIPFTTHKPLQSQVVFDAALFPSCTVNTMHSCHGLRSFLINVVNKRNCHLGCRCWSRIRWGKE